MLERSAKKRYFLEAFNRVERANKIWRRLKHLRLIKSKEGGEALLHSIEKLSNAFVCGAVLAARGSRKTLKKALTSIFNEDDFHWRCYAVIYCQDDFQDRVKCGEG